MTKVSVGLRGWRFDEGAIFDDDGEFRPLDGMDEDDRERLLRLGVLVEQPCDACYLIHGEEGKGRCRQAAVVYGEPGDEVVLCDDHEDDFVYWFREAGGEAYRGDPDLRDAFHEWFDDGGRSPPEYVGVKHVETDPDGLPDPPSPEEVQRRLEAEFDGEEVDLKAAYAELIGEGADEEGETLDPETLADAELDLGADYPTE